MTAHLLERGLNPPAPDEAAKDRLRFVVQVGAEKGLRLAPAGRIAHQHPAGWGWREAGGGPDPGAGDDLPHAALLALPFAHPHPRPPRGPGGPPGGGLWAARGLFRPRGPRG